MQSFSLASYERNSITRPPIASAIARGLTVRVFQKLNRVVRSPTAGLLPGMYGVGPGAGFGRLSRLVADKGWRLQLYSMNLRRDA
jgi:hypothetical protein